MRFISHFSFLATMMVALITPLVAQDAISAEAKRNLTAAQEAWQEGKNQLAWETYRRFAPDFIKGVRHFEPDFGLWVLRRHIDAEQPEQAEALGRAMIIWFDGDRKAIPLEIRGRLAVLFADIALSRQEYARARAQFEAVANNAEFADTPARAEALLRVAEIDRIIRQYDRAIDSLERLSRSADARVRAQAFYQMAQVRFDLEEYSEASRMLDQVFMLEPQNASARILQGQIFLRTNRLVEATDVRVGLSHEQRMLVPGQPLRVGLEDQNLATVGSAELVEVRVWTDNGDEEFFNLFPFGDSRTKFEGEINTALGPVRKGDRTLQVYGGETVYYDFSEAFKKSRGIGETVVNSMTVTSDSELMASSGAILTAEEIARQRFEAMLRQRLIAQLGEAPRESLADQRPANQVKPGNKINVRVVDFGRNITSKPDTVTVRATTTGGDEIAAFKLVETGNHTGVFEGQIPTQPMPAMATASSTREGRDPNFPISAGNHGPWIGADDNIKPRAYTVDLRDNVTLGDMVINAAEQGRKIKDFEIQISLNGVDFDPVGAWPEQIDIWQGNPQITFVRAPQNMVRTMNYQAAREFIQSGYAAQGFKTVTYDLESPRAQYSPEFWSQFHNRVGLRGNDGFVARYRVAFWMPERQTRTIQIASDARHNSTFTLVVDGEATTFRRDKPIEKRVNLAQGLHVVELYVSSEGGSPPRFTFNLDIPEDPYFAPIPDDLVYNQQTRAAFPGIAAEITASRDDTVFNVKFPADTNARMIRLLFKDFEGDAPGITRLGLKNRSGETVLPVAVDLTRLSDNEILEVAPGDRITISYTNPAPVDPERAISEVLLTATYSNATINPVFVEQTPRQDGTLATRYIEMRRFHPGDRVNVMIFDPDADVTPKPDTVPFFVSTAGGKRINLQALETEDHSGVFLGAFFPVSGEPTRPNQIQVAPGEDVTIGYMDHTNTDPGIPWLRYAVAEQALYSEPEMRIYEIDAEIIAELPSNWERQIRRTEAGVNPIKPTYNLKVTRPSTANIDQEVSVLFDGPLVAEVTFPFEALSAESEAILYAQTETARRQSASDGSAFDPGIPGTIKLKASPGDAPPMSAPPGFFRINSVGFQTTGAALEDGRFTFSIPIELGPVPPQTLVDVDSRESPALQVRGDDIVHLGFPYKDDQGQSHWLTAKVRLIAKPFFEVMDRRYREKVDGLHVGETLYFQVRDPSRNLSPENDRITITVRQSDGFSREVELVETLNHSGVFQGHVRLVHSSENHDPEDPSVLVVNHGNTLDWTYQQPNGGASIVRSVTVFKGDDGRVIPFTKTFSDPEMAVRTQFISAEAYFEMAKRHREMGEEVLAQRGIAQGKRILEEAIRDFPEAGMDAHADYLLANLSLELGDMAKDPDQQQRHYLEAIARFTDLTSRYPTSQFAPMAQYKKALTYEKMGDIDTASEEYVKLSYLYPENELVAETIARLGQYFLAKGREMQEAADKMSDTVAREKALHDARQTYRVAAEVFGRLSERFPTHHLAARTLVLSGQCYIRAEDFPLAVRVLNRAVEDQGAPPSVRAEAMYWSADASVKEGDNVSAYRMFRRLTWDYPESNWARFARGRLTEGPMVAISKKE